MRIIWVILCAASVSLFVVAFSMRATTPAETIATYPDAHFTLRPVDPYIVVDPVNRLISDTKDEPILVKYGVGAGGKIALDYDFTANDVNRVTLRVMPLNGFDTTSFGLFYRTKGTTGSDSAAEPIRLVGTRRTSGTFVELQWTADRPFSECTVGLPVGASMVVESIQLSRIATTSRCCGFILSLAFLLPILGLEFWAVHHRDSASTTGTLVFAVSWVVNIGAILWISSLGHNDSVESYRIVSHIVLNGDIVYAHTPRYNYGILWSCLAAATMAVHDWFRLAGPETFHVLIACFLCVPNLVIGVILGRCYSLQAGAVYALLPPLLLITGFHSAIENLGLALGLLAWVIVIPESRRKQTKYLAASAVLMGLSLIAKHYFAFFPVWILVWPGFGSWRRRFCYAAIVYGLFLGHFIPLALDGAAARGILHNVFEYGAIRGKHPAGPFSLLSRALWPLLRSNSHPALTITWVLSVLATGCFVVRRNRIADFPVLYLVPLMAFSPAAADNYLIAPLLACAVFYYRLPSWLYVSIVTLVLLASPLNISSAPLVGRLIHLPESVTPWGIDLHGWLIPQFMASIMLLDLLWTSSNRKIAEPASASADCRAGRRLIRRGPA